MRTAGEMFGGNAKINPRRKPELLYEIMTDQQRSLFESIHDIDFAYEVPALESRFRANIFYGRLGISAVFR